tara:strand:+ start:23 stop:496 length:474 start_codon:yes stop_codon:yes gene_type:complete
MYTVKTDLTTVLADIATVDAVADAIRATDVPAITADIAALPATPRGECKILYTSTASTTFVDFLNITGSGKLISLSGFFTGAGGDLRITVDSTPSIAIALTGSWLGTIRNGVNDTQLFKIDTGYLNTLRFEFQDSLLIEYKADGGSTAYARSVYQED